MRPATSLSSSSSSSSSSSASRDAFDARHAQLDAAPRTASGRDSACASCAVCASAVPRGSLAAHQRLCIRKSISKLTLGGSSANPGLGLMSHPCFKCHLHIPNHQYSAHMRTCAGSTGLSRGGCGTGSANSAPCSSFAPDSGRLPNNRAHGAPLSAPTPSLGQTNWQQQQQQQQFLTKQQLQPVNCASPLPPLKPTVAVQSLRKQPLAPLGNLSLAAPSCVSFPSTNIQQLQQDPKKPLHHGSLNLHSDRLSSYPTQELRPGTRGQHEFLSSSSSNIATVLTNRNLVPKEHLNKLTADSGYALVDGSENIRREFVQRQRQESIAESEYDEEQVPEELTRNLVKKRTSIGLSLPKSLAMQQNNMTASYDDEQVDEQDEYFERKSKTASSVVRRQDHREREAPRAEKRYDLESEEATEDQSGDDSNSEKSLRVVKRSKKSKIPCPATRSKRADQVSDVEAGTPRPKGRAHIRLAAAAEDTRKQCPICERKFSEESFERHTTACEKLNSRKRTVFNAQAKRLKGTGMEKFVGRDSKSTTSSTHTSANTNSTYNSSNEHAGAKRNKAAGSGGGGGGGGGKSSKEGANKPRISLMAMQQMEKNDYISCPHCTRKFARDAGERHIPFCKEVHDRTATGGFASSACHNASLAAASAAAAKQVESRHQGTANTQQSNAAARALSLANSPSKLSPNGSNNLATDPRAGGGKLREPTSILRPPKVTLHSSMQSAIPRLTAQSSFCSDCGTRRAPTARFCSGCGSSH